MGTIYVLVNEAMPGLVKVGKITADGKTVEARMKELDQTGVPMPFECFAAWEVEDVDKAEEALHLAFDDHRLRPRREFFRMSPDKPTAILRAFGSKEVTPSDDVVEAESDKRALDRERRRRANFSFAVVRIEPGTELQSMFDDGIVCTVKDERRVEFRGELVSLSYAALKAAHERGRNWKTINGPAYWKHDGVTLAELRDNLGDSES